MAAFSSTAGSLSRWRVLDAIRRRRVMAAQSQRLQEQQTTYQQQQSSTTDAGELYDESLFSDASSSSSSSASTMGGAPWELPTPSSSVQQVLSLLHSSQSLPSALADSNFPPDDLCSLLDHLHNRPTLALQTLIWSLRNPNFAPSSDLGSRIAPLLPPPKPPSVERFLSDVHAFWMQPSLPMPPYLLDPLLSLYCQAASTFEEIMEAFDLVINKGVKPGVQHYNRVLQTAVSKKHGRVEKAQWLFDRMRKAGPSPDIISYNILIYGYGEEGKAMEAMQVFDEMMGWGIQANEATYASVIAAMAKGKKEEDMERAVKLLQEMKYNGMKPTSETYRIVLKGLCENGEAEKASNMVKEMKGQGMSLDDAILGELLRSLSDASGISEIEARSKLLQQTMDS